MGRHMKNCGVDVPCPNGIHGVKLSLGEIEARIAKLKETMKNSVKEIPPDSEPVTELTAEPTAIAGRKVQSIINDGLCHHRAHGNNSVPGVFIPTLGISPCAAHQPPQAKSQAMGLKEADEFRLLWNSWLSSFGDFHF